MLKILNYYTKDIQWGKENYQVMTTDNFPSLFLLSNYNNQKSSVWVFW